MAQTVSQPQRERSVQETQSATLDCTYDTSDTNYYLFWYKQQRGQVTLIIREEAYKQHNATESRFSVNFQKAAKSFSLEISDAQPGDAATYFCALMERHSDTGYREGLTETSDLSICEKWQAGLPRTS